MGKKKVEIVFRWWALIIAFFAGMIVLSTIETFSNNHSQVIEHGDNGALVQYLVDHYTNFTLSTWDNGGIAYNATEINGTLYSKMISCTSSIQNNTLIPICNRGEVKWTRPFADYIWINKTSCSP